eukprot:TRINITY_DN7535_c1_g1_i1.p1 TRINITY_DN7535_c1_g1~~TRINITY_DN7535_c1_g1_i1.p1  ORF type:complete len:162 (+),score=44.55 TRINITY_DN7535_c1_g1_i1:44-529(+)
MSSENTNEADSQGHEKKNNKLPIEILVYVFESLSPDDLLTCCRVCWEWAHIGSDNAIWWKLSMRIWYEERNRPTKMQKQASKLNWKSNFLSLTSPTPKTLAQKPKSAPKQVKEWKEPPPTKNEMRQWYKSDKRNLKHKNVDKKAGVKKNRQFKSAHEDSDW